MSINGLLNQTITVSENTGHDKFGRKTVGTETDYKCRFQKDTSQVLLPNGQLVTILAKVYVAPSTSIDIEDKVTFDSVDYKVYGKYQAVDGLGATHHYKLDLIKWE